MPAEPHLTDHVFGLARDVPINYVVRDDVDGRLIEDLTRDQHIVIYGSSKQGKTCLRKACLKPEEFIDIQCSNRWSLRDLHGAVLKEAGFRLEQAETRTVSGSKKVLAQAGARIFGVGGEAGGEKVHTEDVEEVTAPLELDIEDVNDVIRALQSIDFDRFIVLEDFHYLPTETQQDFAVALKAFHETSDLSFVIVGVWLEENRLIVYNGDLTGRVIAVDADKWTEPELRKVISKGAKLLNVDFSDAFVLRLLENAESNVYIVQEACRRACHACGVTRTQEEHRTIGDDLDVPRIVREVIDTQSGRYRSFLVQFASGFQDTELEMYKWLLYPILRATIDDLRAGLGYRTIREEIQAKHPRGSDLNPGNLTQALQNVASLQVKKSIKPIILDYDQSNLKLNVVDRGFLIWLKHQDRNELLASAGLEEMSAEQIEMPGSAG